MKQQIQIKRAYEPSEASDGYRIFVDHLWPRGLSHETFKYDMWDKEIAPSTELRKWFHEDPQGRWKEFEDKYKAYLEATPAFASLKQLIKPFPKVTLLYSSHDELHNNAAVLKEMLSKD
ncbi:MAG: DUF488 family protein [Muribaculaceae bacterium]|nr:DUF488 family protein [Muribaculaceae bacterium]